MRRRVHIQGDVQTEVLVASRRRCCLCFFLLDDNSLHKGQIAHLNRNATDSRFDNLVWLCFNHHDEYDGRTSQAKGLTSLEIRTYRDKLYAKYKIDTQPESSRAHEIAAETDESEAIKRQYAEVRRKRSGLDYIVEPWRFPLWQVANRPELFAYKAGNRCDGVCLIERINLPDGRIVVAAIQTAGNPGNSITNCVEALCLQICERFSIPADRLVWLEHYDYHDEWSKVTFSQVPPRGPFAKPRWTAMDSQVWDELRLRPKKRLLREGSEYQSKIHKLFAWPYEAI